MARELKPRSRMDFYPGDYLRDTGHLTTQEHGAYLLLIFHYWGRFCAPNDDDALLSRITKLNRRQWKKIRPIIEEFFTVRDGKWLHFRIEEEMEKASDIMLKRHRAGKTSAEKRRLEATLVEQVACGPSPSPSPSKIKGFKSVAGLEKSPPEKTPDSKASKNKRTTPKLTDEEWIGTLPTLPAFSHLDVPHELNKIDAWIAVNPRRKKTRRFITNWLNRIDKPMQGSADNGTGKSGHARGWSLTEEWDAEHAGEGNAGDN